MDSTTQLVAPLTVAVLLFISYNGIKLLSIIQSNPTVGVVDFLKKYFIPLTGIAASCLILVLMTLHSLHVGRFAAFTPQGIMPAVGISAAFVLAMYVLYRVIPLAIYEQSQQHPWINVSLCAAGPEAQLEKLKEDMELYKKNAFGLLRTTTRVQKNPETKAVMYCIETSCTPKMWLKKKDHIMRIARLCNGEFSNPEEPPGWSSHFYPSTNPKEPGCVVEDRWGFFAISYSLEWRMMLEKYDTKLYRKVFEETVDEFIKKSLNELEKVNIDTTELIEVIYATGRKHGYKKPERPQKEARRDAAYA